MDINQSVLDAVRAHAAEQAPKECCGLIIVKRGKQTYVPCSNIANHGEDRFTIDPMEYADAEDQGEIMCVVHSHPFASPEPSDLDRLACAKSKLPWLIINHPVGHYVLLEPDDYQPPLIGRQFFHGVLDCYTLVRDYYATHGIVLPDFERPDDWWNLGQNLYVDNFEQAGFVRVFDAPRPHDAFLMQIRSSVPNHAAVYLGDELILHHLYHRLSSRDVYGGYWQKATTYHLRHRSLINA